MGGSCCHGDDTSPATCASFWEPILIDRCGFLTVIRFCFTPCWELHVCWCVWCEDVWSAHICWSTQRTPPPPSPKNSYPYQKSRQWDEKEWWREELMKAAVMETRRWRAGRAARCWRSVPLLWDAREDGEKKQKAIKKWGEMWKMSKWKRERDTGRG